MNSKNLEDNLFKKTADREVRIGEASYYESLSNNLVTAKKIKVLTKVRFFEDDLSLDKIKTNFIVKSCNEVLVNQILNALKSNAKSAAEKFFIMVCNKGSYYEVIDGNHVVEALKLYYKENTEKKIKVKCVFEKDIPLYLYPLLQTVEIPFQYVPMTRVECINAIRLILCSCRMFFIFDESLDNYKREENAKECILTLFKVPDVGNFVRYLWVFDNDEHWNFIMDKFGKINDYNFWVNLCKRYYRSHNSTINFYQNCKDERYNLTYEYILKINNYVNYNVNESEIFTSLMKNENPEFFTFNNLQLKYIEHYKAWIVKNELKFEIASILDCENKNVNGEREKLFKFMCNECKPKFVKCVSSCCFCEDKNGTLALIEKMSKTNIYAASLACFVMFRNSNYRCKTIHDKFDFFYQFTTVVSAKTLIFKTKKEIRNVDEAVLNKSKFTKMNDSINGKSVSNLNKSNEIEEEEPMDVDDELDSSDNLNDNEIENDIRLHLIDKEFLKLVNTGTGCYLISAINLLNCCLHIRNYILSENFEDVVIKELKKILGNNSGNSIEDLRENNDTFKKGEQEDVLDAISWFFDHFPVQLLNYICLKKREKRVCYCNKDFVENLVSERLLTLKALPGNQNTIREMCDNELYSTRVCDVCKENEIYNAEYTILNTTKYLFIRLNSRPSPEVHHVISNENFNINNFVFGYVKWMLIGCIEYDGNSKAGHYITWKRGLNNKWTIIDDNRKTYEKSSFPEDLNRFVFLLFIRAPV